MQGEGNGKSRTITKKKMQLSLLKKKKKMKRKLRAYKGGIGRATEISPAGAVCWEQVVYLGQHIASSAFLPTRLSERRRGKPAKRAALLRVSASVPNISTVHALSGNSPDPLLVSRLNFQQTQT